MDHQGGPSALPPGTQTKQEWRGTVRPTRVNWTAVIVLVVPRWATLEFGHFAPRQEILFDGYEEKSKSRCGCDLICVAEWFVTQGACISGRR